MTRQQYRYAGGGHTARGFGVLNKPKKKLSSGNSFRTVARQGGVSCSRERAEHSR